MNSTPFIISGSGGQKFGPGLPGLGSWCLQLYSFLQALGENLFPAPSGVGRCPFLWLWNSGPCFVAVTQWLVIPASEGYYILPFMALPSSSKPARAEASSHHRSLTCGDDPGSSPFLQSITLAMSACEVTQAQVPESSIWTSCWPHVFLAFLIFLPISI